MGEKKGRESQDLESERDQAVISTQKQALSTFLFILLWLLFLSALSPSPCPRGQQVQGSLRPTSGVYNPEPPWLPKTVFIEVESLNWTQNPLILNPAIQLALGTLRHLLRVLDLQVSCHTHHTRFAWILGNSTSGPYSCYLHDNLFNRWVISSSLLGFVCLFCFETCGPGLPQILLLLAFVILGLQVWGTTQRPGGFLVLFLRIFVWQSLIDASPLFLTCCHLKESYFLAIPFHPPRYHAGHCLLANLQISALRI